MFSLFLPLPLKLIKTYPPMRIEKKKVPNQTFSHVELAWFAYFRKPHPTSAGNRQDKPQAIKTLSCRNPTPWPFGSLEHGPQLGC